MPEMFLNQYDSASVDKALFVSYQQELFFRLYVPHKQEHQHLSMNVYNGGSSRIRLLSNHLDNPIVRDSYNIFYDAHLNVA